MNCLEQSHAPLINVEYALLPIEVEMFEKAIHAVCLRNGIPGSESQLGYDRHRNVIVRRMVALKHDVKDPFSDSYVVPIGVRATTTSEERP